jgi:glutamate-ammonia-ligase adenylyltransferase
LKGKIFPEKNKLEDLNKHIIEQTKGFFKPEELDEFFSLIEKESKKKKFTNSSFVNFERIIKSVFDLRAFVADALKYPHYIEIIATVAHNSNYLTDILVRTPSLIYQILTPSFLLPKITEGKLEGEIKKGVARFKSFDSKVKFLRRLKNKNMLIIGTRDLLNLSDLVSTVEELSILARLIAATLFELSLNEILAQNKIDEEIKYAIASLGKLGGNELNYSSDIDLIFFFEENYSFKGKEVFELLSDAIKLFTEASTEHTADGFLYRVDFRLRPDGKYSPLIKSYKDYIYYYETRGENWERQMLQKMSFLGGSEELYDKFRKRLRPFISPSSIPENHFASVLKMKTEIEKKAGDNYDIKNISGGIRDIEFSVQALQTINNKRFPELLEQNTLTAIEKLSLLKLITEKEAKTLTENYLLYRKIEHYLQLMNDAQTHVIPANGEILEKMIAFLNYKNEKTFFKELDKRRKEVRKIFNNIVDVKGAIEESKIQFTDKNKASRNLKFIFKGEGLSGSKNFDKLTIKQAGLIEEKFLDLLEKAEYPDKALDNFSKLLSITKLPSIFLKEMNDNKFIESTLFLCQYADKVINLLLQNPKFIDDYLSRKAHSAEIIGEKDLRKVEFYLVLRFALSLIKAEGAGRLLSESIENIIRELSDKYFGEDVFVAALGSFALREMTFSSDVDLLIFSSKKKVTNAAQKNAEKFFNELHKALLPFQVDFRLRPEGESSQLIWNLEGVKKYFEKRISPWELIALLKLRFIAGSKETFSDFVDIFVNKISSVNKDEFLIELRKIYNKLLSTKTKFASAFDLKFSHGGITTIDFTMLPEIIINESAENIREKLLSQTLLSKSGELDEIRLKYKELLVAQQVLFDVKKSTLPEKSEEKIRLEKFVEKIGLINELKNVSNMKNIVVKKFGALYG